MGTSKYLIIYDEDFNWKKFNLIPKNLRKLIQKAIEKRLMTEPLKYGKPLYGLWKGKFKLRVSVYRIIYEVKDETVIVKIISIGHRSTVYKI